MKSVLIVFASAILGSYFGVKSDAHIMPLRGVAIRAQVAEPIDVVLGVQNSETASAVGPKCHTLKRITTSPGLKEKPPCRPAILEENVHPSIRADLVCRVSNRVLFREIVNTIADICPGSESPRNRQPMAASTRPKVSVVIPCLDEERTLGACIDKAHAAFEAAGIVGEVVVADNGSRDSSIEIAERHGARVFHAAVKGYGSALRRGMDEARGEFIVLGDADGSHDFSEMQRFIDKWREGYEFVVGNRFRGEIKDRAMPWHHKYLGTPFLSRLLHLFFGAGVGDINCGMRGMTRELSQRLDFRTTGMEFASESLIKAAKAGVRMAEVPITMWPDRRGRPPHLRPFHDGWRHLRFILLSAPNWLFLAPGALLVALGIGLVLWLLPGIRFAGKVGLDVHTMALGMMLALVGVHIISIGLFVKVFSYTEKLTRNQVSLARLLKHVRLEHGLLLGATLTLAGFVGDAFVFWNWAANGFGHLQPVRTVFFCSVCFFLGIEVIFSSVFLSMLGISRATYIGD
jgi:glycosyl transferase family 2